MCSRCAVGYPSKQTEETVGGRGALETGMYTGVLFESGFTLNRQEWTRGRGVVYIDYMLGETESGIYPK